MSLLHLDFNCLDRSFSMVNIKRICITWKTILNVIGVIAFEIRITLSKCPIRIMWNDIFRRILLHISRFKEYLFNFCWEYTFAIFWWCDICNKDEKISTFPIDWNIWLFSYPHKCFRLPLLLLIGVIKSNEMSKRDS